MTNPSDSPTHAVPVAVIGIGCFFPKAQDLKDYWRLLYQGVDAVEDIPESHWSPEDYYDSDPRATDRVYCKRGAFLSPVPFDPTTFGIPPANLDSTDTSQILGLMAAQRALADAGYGNGNGKAFDRSRTSVILGVTGTQELVIPLSSRLSFPQWKSALEAAGVDPETTRDVVARIADGFTPWQENSFPGLLGNVVAGRICNRLDLNGTNCVVDAACASSMSAINLALMELQTGRSDMVVTGGVDTLSDIFMHMCFARTQILSPTGDARPFSEDADGTVLGEGVGLVVLKRLDAAERDGDRIYAVIKGIGASSDGKSQSIYAPRPEGQAKALRKAYESAGVRPDSVGLVEAHGTGTRVGDKIEIRALKQVFGETGEHKRTAIGSVKSMIGHTKAAAGAAGLIKAVLALHHKVLPPTLKVSAPDPEIGIEDSPFYLNPKSRPWFASGSEPRRAGVSAFGFGGSNFHVVLEEYQQHKDRREAAWDGSVQIIALSEASMDALRMRLTEWREAAGSESFPEELPHRSAESRRRFSADDGYRLLMVVSRDRESGEWNTDAVLADGDKLLGQEDGPAFRSAGSAYFGSGPRPGKIAFAFPGQGSQYCGMGQDVVSWFPEAVAVMDRANHHFKGDGRLTDLIYPVAASTKEDQKNQEDRLRNTAVAQPALGGVSLAMGSVLQRFGVTPEGTCGHSYGELAALWAAGWIDEPTLHELSNLRGQLMAAAGGGTMAAIKAPLDQIEALIAAEDLDVVLANRNTPTQGVLSGSVAAIEAAEKVFKANKMRAIRLQVSAAFHSELVESARGPFAEGLKDVAFTPTDIPVYANTTGKAYPTDTNAVRTLLGNHLRNPVNFVDEVINLFADGFRVFLEVGPKTVMKGLVGAVLKEEDHHAIAVDASGGKQFGIEDLGKALAHLASLGQGVLLSEWESGDTPPEPRKMSVPISGANLKPKPNGGRPRPEAGPGPSSRSTGLAASGIPKTAASPPTAPATAIQPVHPTVSGATAAACPGSAQPIAAAPAPQAATAAEASPVDATLTRESNQPPNWQAALAAVEAGVRSMEAIHLQTAQAHEKFLETQAATARAIQEMMQQTGAMVGGWKPQESTTPNLEADPAAVLPPPPVACVSHPAELTAPSPGETQTLAMSAETVPASLENRSAATPTTANSNSPVAEILIGIVSQLTGYPTEMLSLDMDMESDLGIDSIKRVEILSAIEEQMPGLGPASPEIMADLRTLGQVAAALGSGVGEAGTTTPRTAVETVTAMPVGGESVESPAEVLVGVVSDLTGYPPEMLSLDMDVEADLGIDSIKRVEILSAIEERMPALPPVTPDEMAGLRTLGQIAARLSQASGEVRAILPTDPAAADPPQPGEAAVEDTLLQVVSELTGYPRDMLTGQMDIEADLGIDSIKRVEILSVMEERLPHLPAAVPEDLAVLKTLSDIAAYLSQKTGAPAPSQSPEPSIVATAAPEAAPPLDRRTITAMQTPFEKHDRLPIPSGKRIFITTERSGLSSALSETLSARGLRTVLISLDILKHRQSLPEAAGLIIVSDSQPPQTGESLILDTSPLKDSFDLLKALEPDLTRTGGTAGETALLATITRLDGAFGFSGEAADHPVQGGLAGLVKTAAQEWDGVVCRAIDIDPKWTDPAAAARSVADELLFAKPDGPLEIGMTRDARFTLAETADRYPAAAEALPVVDPGGVVVISGGARGVTAAAAKAIAACQPATLVLLGRSPVPEPEPDWLKSVSGAADVKKAILENDFNGQTPKPVAVEAAYRRRMANREILETLSAIESTGSKARYFSVDVRDREKVAAVLKDIRMVHGPVSALIHGAGVLEDRLIKDKTAEQFESVLDTKIKGLENLLAATAGDPLHHLIFFSSAAARYGNRGQADYAAANEVLNKTARVLAREMPDCRVLALNWGPWDGGMVTDALRREFIKNGVSLISVAAGVHALLCEMGGEAPTATEIVVGSGFPLIRRQPAAEVDCTASALTGASDPSPPLEVHFQRDIDEKNVPVLAHHKLDGKPVLPFALMAEWFAHSALHGNPGLLLNGIDDMRLLKGVVIEAGAKHIRLMAGRARQKDSGYAVDVELRNGFKGGLDVVHSRATAILSDTLPEAPSFSIPERLKQGEPYGKPAESVYRDVLFHGEALQGIQEVKHLTPEGMVAVVNTAPAPETWMIDPPRNRWIADPLVLDCAYQMASLWCFEAHGRVSLPSYNASYRQYRRVFPSEPILAVLEVREATRYKMTGDFTFLDAENQVIATIRGHEAIMDDTLIQAFKPEKLAAAG